MSAIPRSRWLIFGAVVLAVVFVVAFLAIRWALDPRLLKTTAESRLSAALGQPVTIGSVHLSFLPALTVVGTDVVVGSARPPAASVDVGAIRLRVRLLTIFRRPIVIDRIELDGVTVHARRDRTGRLILPLPAGVRAPANAEPQAAAVAVSEILLKRGRLTIAQEGADGRGDATVTPIDNLDATLHDVSGVLQLDKLTASVGRSTVDGSGSMGPDGARLGLRWTDLKPADIPMVFALLGTSSPPGLSLEGKRPLSLDVQVTSAGDISASGRISVDRASLGTLAISQFASPIALRAGRLTLDPMTLHAYSGAGRGNLAANVVGTPMPWTFNANLDRVNMQELVNANTTAKDKVSGTGGLTARLRGSSRVPIERTIAGTVSVAIANGTIRDFPLLSAVYGALKLGPGGDRDLHFQSLAGTFNVADARATTNDLVARTGEMTMRASGTIGFDQSMAMTGSAVFSAAKSAEFVHSIRELSSLENGTGEIEVPFTVSGTVNAPHFSIDVADILRRGMQNELKRRLGDKLRDLFKRK